jgi:hypothetical protein
MGEWLSICRTYCIPQRTSEPTYQHQNRVERRIQDIKHRATVVLMTTHSAPSRYWDYAVECTMELINHTAVRRLSWRTPYEVLHGDTPDISVFRFIFYEPTYYLEPNIQFPNPNMLPGRFLGIARTTGDSFTFIIETVGKIRNIALHRSIIRRRDPINKDPYSEYQEEKPLDEEPHQSIDNTEETNELPYEEKITNEQELPYAEVILNEPSNFPHNGNEPEIMIHAGDEEYQEEHTKEIYNHFDEEIKCDEILNIISSKFDETDGKLYLEVEWNDGKQSSIDAQLMQSDDPIRLAKYIKDNPVERLRGGYWSQWAGMTLHSISGTTHRIRRM